MIRRIVTLDTAVDLFLSEVDDPVAESKIENYRTKAMSIAADMFNQCQAPLWPRIKEGRVEGNVIDLPEDYAKFEKCRVDNNNATITMQNFLTSGSVTKSDNVDAVYKGVVSNHQIIFNVIGGSVANLHHKPYVLEYKALPMVDGVLLMPENFVTPIALGLRVGRALDRAERTGKGITLWQSLNKQYEIKKEEAIVDVEFPSFEELMSIGKIWESKVPAGIPGANRNNFNNF
jgi:hypothetical protein